MYCYLAYTLRPMLLNLFDHSASNPYVPNPNPESGKELWERQHVVCLRIGGQVQADGDDGTPRSLHTFVGDWTHSAECGHQRSTQASVAHHNHVHLRDTQWRRIGYNTNIKLLMWHKSDPNQRVIFIYVCECRVTLNHTAHSYCEISTESI